jgi:transcription factor TFIIIB component B''
LYEIPKRKSAPKPSSLPAPVLPPPPPEEEEEAPPAGPQVKIVDGEIVLQESSMMVPSARKTVQEVEEEYQQVVEEEGHTTIVGASYNSFVARRKPQHWAVEETKLFYHALRQVGADFVTMEAFYKNRTRKQLKKKYQTEQVKNPHLIELALDPRNKLPVESHNL